MKVIQIVSGISDESSGPANSVPGLCRGLIANGVDSKIFTMKFPNIRDMACPVKYHQWGGRNWLRVGISPDLEDSLEGISDTTSIFHSNGCWMMMNVYPGKIVRRRRKTMGKQDGYKSFPMLVTAPRGCFAKWAWNNGWIKKHIFGWFCGQFAALNATDMWHATSEKEYDEIRGRGYRQPVAIVPIGMDLPDVSSGFRVSGFGLKKRLKRVVFFGRLHKVKAVDNLVLAWAKLADRFTDWELLIAGPDRGVRSQLESIISEKHVPRITFVGEINGQVKYDFLASADIYVLPSHTENFGITVAEALACGTPVIASQGTPWSGLEHEKAGRWVQIGVAPLAEALREMMSMDDEELRQMGERGRQWIVRDFSWKGIGEKMKMAYKWLLGCGSMPDWVRID